MSLYIRKSSGRKSIYQICHYILGNHLVAKVYTKYVTKADIFDGGHRVPFVVRWPGKVKAGSEYSHLVSTVDFFATAADVVGAGERITPTEAEDSFSFLPALTGDQQAIRLSLIHHSIGGQFAIRRGKWKLCLCPGSGGWSAPRPNVALKDTSLPPVQLYDLESVGRNEQLVMLPELRSLTKRGTTNKVLDRLHASCAVPATAYAILFRPT